MDISLSSKLAEFVRRKVESGAYDDPLDVIEHALDLLEDQDALRAVKLEAFRKEIALGIEQADRGQVFEGPEVFDRLRDRLRSRAEAER